ncbi:aminotransferase class I/II-fold pyridoxal phosphate-dependent enzyme [Oceanobacillus sp. CAU 1775]
MNQSNIPILHMLENFQKQQPISFHVPGHKNGKVFPEDAATYFKEILKIDMTELPGLDDLHAPEAAIKDAENLASDYFKSDHTFFLVGGSTAGNLAMILATCKQDEKVLVQRNSHKSIMNGLELAGARPIFLNPQFDKKVERYTNPSYDTVATALQKHPDAKAIILTYPDYFGKTYEIKSLIELAHRYKVPVLVDEAHGVHFSLGKHFPASALDLGADVVVHSAHKMAPAMTMASFLHVKSKLISKEKLAYYLQMIQSSSPSYPLMASLDISRAFLAGMSQAKINRILESANIVKNLFTGSDYWQTIPAEDSLKLTIQAANGVSAKEIANSFEAEGIYPELVTDRQILFIHGLQIFTETERLKKVIETVKEKLKNKVNHATIEVVDIFTESMQEIALSYREMQELKQRLVPLEESVGLIAAEAVTPYPPGIPFILKGELITSKHIQAIEQMVEQGVRIQQREKCVHVFCSN